MKQNIKNRKSHTLTLVFIMIIFCIVFTAISHETFLFYNTDNGFAHPKSNILWLPILDKHEDTQGNTPEEQM